MAQYLRSLSIRIPAVTACLLNGPVYLSAREFSQLGSLSPHSHTFVPGFYLPSVKPNQHEGLGIRPGNSQRSHLPPLLSESAPPPIGNGKLYADLLVCPQPKPNQNEKNASAFPSDKSCKNPDGKPTPDQLNRVYLALQEEIPETFSRAPDSSLLTENVVLVDNIRGKVFKGLSAYLSQFYLLRFVGHLKYSSVTAEIVSMSQDLKDGRVVVQWRIKGVLGFRVFLKFWQIRFWDWKSALNQKETWHDGISYYDVSGIDGKIYKHTVDRVIKDRLEEELHDKKLRLLEKLKLAGASGAFVSPLIIVGTLDCIAPT